jgi:DNA polymerase
MNDPQEIASRLRQALELQMLIREGTVPFGEAAAALRRSATTGSRNRVQPAARVTSPETAARAAAAPRAEDPVAAPLPSRAAPTPAEVSLAPGHVQGATEHVWQRHPSASTSLGGLHDDYAACQRCALGDSRTNFVFGTGNPEADVMFVGEAPGRDEDQQGEPFVGRAGQLLNKILEAIGFRREDVYIANILKCRPPGNRDPQPTEIVSCEPILQRQIELIRPLILCSLGSFAAKTLLQTSTGITRLRGRIHEYRGIPLVPTFHPAALLRNAQWKRPTWEDVQLLRREYDRLREEAPQKGSAS